EYREQWVSEGDQPGNTGEQREPHEHSQGEANNPRFIPLVLRQLVREYRDKDQVVYAEDNLEDNQGQQAEQDGRVEKLFDHEGQDVGAMAEYATSREQPLNSPSSCRSRGRTPAPAAEDAAAGAPQVTPSRSVRGPSPAAAKTRSRARYRGRVPTVTFPAPAAQARSGRQAYPRHACHRRRSTWSLVSSGASPTIAPHQ